MNLLPLRLLPGADLRRALEAALAADGASAAFVVAGIGSLADAPLRLAGAGEARVIAGASELLTLSGSVGADASHLHATLADATGRVWGGHVGYGCRVRTTAEILLARLSEWQFSRTFDPRTGFAELEIARKPLA
ncbi:PPC domain-containing DNA-binding protein [Piscinibacter koreensis]|uniref:DUF296 domain-containing protein n=1 Tax=Piscinibacter koreensis TaxID=2742824 RepID=A0A7Y6TVZ6_9BURK|nr:PPC domain-containing DNA-binding protein [Schlegelella koreensis]NUZ05540.1 DUF296 domain-containing protein [Schlegelella koreensis]